MYWNKSSLIHTTLHIMFAVIFDNALFFFSDVLCTTCNVPEKLFTVIFWLGYCNSLMNPIIYASSSREFKRAFIKVLRCYWCRRRCDKFDISHFNLPSGYHRRSGTAYMHGSMRVTRFNENSYLSRSMSHSPVKSLIVYQDRRSPPTPTQHLSKRSSYSDIDDAEFAGLNLEQLDRRICKYSEMIWCLYWAERWQFCGESIKIRCFCFVPVLYGFVKRRKLRNRKQLFLIIILVCITLLHMMNDK